MPKHGLMLSAAPPRKAGGKRAGAPKSKVAAAAKPVEVAVDFNGFTLEEQAFLDGMAKHRSEFSAAAVIARSESHRKKS